MHKKPTAPDQKAANVVAVVKRLSRDWFNRAIDENDEATRKMMASFANELSRVIEEAEK